MTSKYERNTFEQTKEKVYRKPVNPEIASLLTLREVAQIFRVSFLTLKRWEKKGKIKAIRINSRGDRRYLRSEINKLLGGNVWEEK